MLFKPSVMAGLIAAFLAAPPFPTQAALLVSPDSPIFRQSNTSPAQEKVDEGVKALHSDDLNAAELAFTEATKINPGLPSAYLGLAEIAGRRNNVTQVENWLQKALNADPGRAFTHVVWGHYQFQRGQFAKAEAAYKKAIELDSSSVDAQIYLAENYLRGLKNPKAAEGAYRAAIALDASSVAAHQGLAGTLAAQNRFDEAVAEYEQTGKLAPKDPLPTHALARLYASQGKFDLALAALQRTTAVAPDFLPAYIDRGDLYLGKNELDKAATAYLAGAKATSKPAIAYFKLGAVLEGQQRWADAEQAYLDAIKSDPLMYGAYNNLAFMAAARKEHLDEALTWAKKAIEIAPKVTTLLDTLGWVHFARGELKPAAKAIEKAVADNPKKASFRYHLGVIYAEQGKKKEAAVMLNKALELDKNFYQAEDARKRLQQISALQ
jgi:tetratricopeptide (TPR) repeat protein